MITLSIQGEVASIEDGRWVCDNESLLELLRVEQEIFEEFSLNYTSVNPDLSSAQNIVEMLDAEIIKDDGEGERDSKKGVIY